METKPENPEVPSRLSDWAEITECLCKFPPPETAIDSDGDVETKAWVFRGHRSSYYQLQPAIERETHFKSMSWPALEELALSEFKARARTHLRAPSVPGDEEKFTWLAEMQHYAIPTRLLDFTYSPFVALYFSVRHGHEEIKRTDIRLWGVDARAVNRRFRAVASNALAQGQSDNGGQFWAASLDPDEMATDRDNMITEIQGLHTLIVGSLSGTGKRRAELNRRGCVCAASPPTFNPRLVNQQGVFLINCAEDLSFWESLNMMMKGCGGWLKTFDISVGLIPEIEGRLFQMNIHEQSLFPDLEGLAGLVRQKMRLHWK